MIFRDTELAGVFVIEPERSEDGRGFFARTWCRDEFARHGLATEFAQCSTSFNRKRGTLRGIHFQAAPHAETKLIRCTRGRVFDVAVDLRARSPTRGRWAAAELSAENGRMIYIPEGVAHGFQTLEDSTELFYQITLAHHAESVRGVRWDDPDLAIQWPMAAAVMSRRDRANPLFPDAQS